MIHIRSLHCLVAHDREISDGSVFVRGNKIECIGTRSEVDLHIAALPDTDKSALQLIDGAACIAIPGLVNTHHHMYQTLTRVVPAAQDVELFTWLKKLYPIWAGLTPEAVRVSTQLAAAELILSGCTTSSDHLYIFPNGVRLDDEIEAALNIGLRFTACRGAMSVGQSQGGLPPDYLIEDEAAILRDCERVSGRFHDSSFGAMTQIAIAPCSPFSVSQDLMREAAVLARQLKVRLHTHLAENDNDIAYTLEKYHCTPAQYCEQLGWLGADVWHAHCVKLDAQAIALFGATGTGVAHCPSSNMRLASGIAPVPALIAAGAPVSIAVDGSASNDGATMIGEARLAMLLARLGQAQEASLRGVAPSTQAFSARATLEMATQGGAKVLGRNDIGSLKVGQCADIALFDLNDIAYAGAWHDPLAALLFCAPTRVKHSIINGQVVVRNGELTTLELPRLIAEHNRLAMALCSS